MKTPKMYLAAALMSLGAGLDKQRTDRTDSRRIYFYLTFSSPVVDDEDEWFQKNIKSWEDRTLSVNAQAFVDAIQELKTEVHRT